MEKIHKDHIKELETNGFCLIKGFFSESKIAELQKTLSNTDNCRFCIDAIPALRPYAKFIQSELSSHSPDLMFNRSIFFNKNPQKNWAVLWHQDLTICVKEKLDAEGYGPWSIKEGVHHVKPPLHILKSMITARLHIDDSSAENGTLKVIPRSHNSVLDRSEMNHDLDRSELINAERGDLLLMKPLLLHSSESSLNSSLPRRVLHLEFLTEPLHSPLELFHSKAF